MRYVGSWLRLSAALLAATVVFPVVATSALSAQDRLRIVTTLPTFSAITQEVAGDRAEVSAIARGDEDPHFVNARPSFAAMLQRADVFVTTGLDLELWVPTLLDRANNPKVMEGAPGHVVAYSGVKLLEVPETVSRAGGDVHVFGNPHIHADPVNGIIIARNIVEGLKRADPQNATTYDANLKSFEDRILRRTFGDELVDLLGAQSIFDLARSYEFWDFARSQSYQGRPLTSYLGGWLAEGAPFRDRRIVCYHKNWAYFSARFLVECAMFVERKPGIPPSPGHVRQVIDFIKREHIPVLLAANYYSRGQVERVASRGGIQALIVPEHVAGAKGVDDYFALIDLWVSRLAQVFQASATRGHP
jgi:ABC-type Zn uptake system ZnuABC Zn-binding protein ZnuA